MTTDALSSAPSIHSSNLPLSLRIAVRELRGGLRGFYIFLFCVALGVAAIASIGSLSDALKSGLAQEGQAILGGDMEFSLNHRRITADERSFLTSKGEISEIAAMRAMAISEKNKKNTLIGLKAVDKAFPLYGSAVLESGNDLQKVLRETGAIVVDPLLLKRLGVARGDDIKIGDAVLKIADLIKSEPDRLSGPPILGPAILMSQKTLEKTGLAAPGSLVRWSYRLRLPESSVSPETIKEIKKEAEKSLSDSGFSIRDRNNPAPMIRRAINQMTQFLTFVGLTALIVGGVGVANGVTTYLDRKRRIIAAFKCLGAPSSLISRIYFLQVLIVAGLGIIIGLIAGALLPWLVSTLFAGILPFTLQTSVHPSALLLAAAYGLLVAVLFVLWPLGRAEQVKPQALVRENISEESVVPPRRFIAAAAIVAALLVGVTIASAEQGWIALYFCAGLTILFLLFYALGRALHWGFRRMPRPKRPELALAVTNLAAPGSLTRSVTLSLGTGLSLLVAVALIDHSMVSELKTGLPKNAPNYFFLDIGKEQMADFKQFVKKSVPGGELNDAPMLRGRIVNLAGRPVETTKPAPNAAWVLRGDRGLTYSATVPEGSTITEGKWWPKDYDGEPVLSFEEELAKGLGLKIGDEVTVNILGRNVSAKIMNFRTLKWESLSINFVMIFSPNALQGAPFNMLATLHTDNDPEAAAPGDSTKVSFVQTLTEKFPNITVIRVRDTIEAVNSIFSKLMTGIRAAGGLTLLAGSLVLAGALATAHRSRIYQAVILKTLGATRRRIISSHILEYLILALLTSLLAVLFGIATAWVVVTQLMDLGFTLSVSAIAQAISLAVVLVVALGAAGSWRVLSAKVAPELRSNS